MIIPAASLEDWLRDRYFSATCDLGCSGVASWSFRELRELTGLDLAAVDDLLFDDGPSCGSLALRTAIADRYYAGRAELVMVTPGSSEAIFATVASIVQPGDDVLVFTPAYHALKDVACAVGARVVEFPLDLDGAAPVDFAELRRAMAASPKAVVANFPHNPSGASLTPSQLRELVELCAAHDAYLLWDGAFAELAFADEPLPDPVLSYDRCVSFGTYSKAFGLPGLRVGWCAAQGDILDRLLPWRDRISIAVSPLNDLIAASVMAHADVVLAARRTQLEANRAFVAKWLAAHRDLIAGAVGPGGVTAFPRLVGGDSTAICTTLLDKHGVLVVPGECFGQEDRIRLGFGCSSESLRQGLEALADVLRARRARKEETAAYGDNVS